MLAFWCFFFVVDFALELPLTILESPSGFGLSWLAGEEEEAFKPDD